MKQLINAQAEEAILAEIVQTENIVLLTTVNEDWFTEDRANLLNLLRTKKECMQFFYCTQHVEENMLQINYPLIVRVFKDFRTEDIDSCLQIIEEKYLMRCIEELGNYTLNNLKKLHPLVLASNIQEMLAKFKYSGKKLEKLGDTFEPDTMDLIDVGIPAMETLCLSRQEIMVLGGERGQHKTNFALWLAAKALHRNVVELNNKSFKILFFSREMSFKAVKARLLAQIFKISFLDIRRGKYDKDKIQKEFLEKYWYFNDNFIVVPPEQINGVEDIAKFILQEKPTIWLFDYMQLLARSIAGKDGDTHGVIAWLVTRFKSIAQLTNTLGVLISTLSKFDKNRLNHIPRLEDLYSSVEIQYLASWVGLCYWSWFYNRSLNPQPFFVLWEKNRNEEPFTMPLKVEPPFSNFDNLQKGMFKLTDYLPV